MDEFGFGLPNGVRIKYQWSVAVLCRINGHHFRYWQNERKNPLVTAVELEALIRDWGAQPGTSVDRFFPFRFWYLLLITAGYGLWLLFSADTIALALSSHPTDISRLTKFLYFRGWFIAVILSIGGYSYFKNWYPAIVFSAIFLVGCVNFAFDLFNVYAEILAKPTPKTTLMLFLRIIALWFLFLSVRNASRLPDLKDRLNIFLPFKRKV